MRKFICRILPALLLPIGFVSCVDEDGAGVPAEKSMYVESSEYTINPEDEGGMLVLRWIDVTNAAYAVSFSNDENDVVEMLSNGQTAGDLSTMSMNIPYTQILAYVELAGLSEDEDGNIDINVNITGTPIDDTKPTALSADGSTVTAVIHITSSQSDEEGGEDDAEE